MSYTRQLLYSLADGMGRNRKQMDPYILILQKNWYDTQQSLQTLSINDYDRFEIPRRLAAMISERIGTPKQQMGMGMGQQQYGGQQQMQYGGQGQFGGFSGQGQGQYHQQSGYQQGQYRGNMMMEQEVSVVRLLEALKQKCPKQKFNEFVQTLAKLFSNIRTNITQQKYRTLKKSNPKISQLLSIKQNAQILSYGGFEDAKDIIIVKNVNIGKIDDCLESLAKFNQATKFDPYKSQITNISGQNNNFQGQSSVVYNDKLKEQEKKREQIMSMPIRDRQIKIYREVGKEIKADSNWNDQRQLNEHERLYADSIKQQLKNYGQDPKFMNRRKQQYFELIKKPCFSQTLIKVKLPDNWIFQCKFSPMETLGELVKIFHEHVQNKNLSYYLYMTPPVEKLNGMVLRQTFYDKGCVPRAIFYFGTDEKINGPILRQKKTGFFG